VPSLFDRRTQASVTSYRYMRKTWPENTWHSAIPVDTRLRDASSRGITPLELDRESRGIQSYGSLLKTLLQLDLRATETISGNPVSGAVYSQAGAPRHV